MGLCAFCILLIAGGLLVRWRKGRLRFFVPDGAATRPDPKVVVPILWLVMGARKYTSSGCEQPCSHPSAVLCGFAIWMRSATKNRRLSFGFGVYWWMIGSSLACSYCIISASGKFTGLCVRELAQVIFVAICSAPAIRRILMKMNQGRPTARVLPSVVLLNTLIGLICIGLILAPYAGGRLTGDCLRVSHNAYQAAQAILRQASLQQDMAQLMNLQPIVAELGVLTLLATQRHAPQTC